MAAGGAEGLLRLASAWHVRVMADEVVSHAFSHGIHPEHTQRLAAYWAEALGGPRTFSTEYGDETSVVRMHSGNGPHDEMDRRAIACFDQALADVGLGSTTGSDRCCTITSRGRRRPRCRAITAPRMMCRTVLTSRTGRGPDWSARRSGIPCGTLTVPWVPLGGSGDPCRASSCLTAQPHFRCRTKNLAASSPANCGTPVCPPMLACSVFSWEPKASNRSRPAAGRFLRRPTAAVRAAES